MRQITILLAIVFILIFASFSIGLGWNVYIIEKIKPVAGGNQATAIEQSSPEAKTNISEITAKNVRVKIAKRAAYKRDGYAEINFTVKNTDGFAGNAEIAAILYYAHMPFANATILVRTLEPDREVAKTIIVNTTKDWSAFEVKQV
jgi:hypothetical protein